jgi:hypothetical protein
MKLSEANRAGSKLRGESRRGRKRMQASYFDRDRPDGAILGSDASGAAFEATFNRTDFLTETLVEAYPDLGKEADCPKCGSGCSGSRALHSRLTHLYDGGWSREEIADWLQDLGL